MSGLDGSETRYINRANPVQCSINLLRHGFSVQLFQIALCRTRKEL